MPENIHEWLTKEFFGNPLQQYLFALAIFAGGILFLNLIRLGVFSRLKKVVAATPTTLDDFLLALANKRLIPILRVGAFYFAVRQLVYPAIVERWVYSAVVIALTFCATRLVLDIALYLMTFKVLKKGTVNQQKDGAAVSATILSVIRVVVWGVAGVFVLDNLGFNVSAVVAGLGIGGVAIALAAQNILGDLFNYFVIFFDRPFEEGDFIIVGEYMGTIEHIGIKTTRVRSLGGEQIVFANADLTGSRIRNYKRMRERRILFAIGVIYETPREKLDKIPGILKQVIEQTKLTRFDRAHFKSYGSYSLDFEVVYYVLDPDYNKFMDVQQSINFKLKEIFEQEGIDFAYPTQVEYFKELAGSARPKP